MDNKKIKTTVESVFKNFFNEDVEATVFNNIIELKDENNNTVYFNHEKEKDHHMIYNIKKRRYLYLIYDKKEKATITHITLERSQVEEFGKELDVENFLHIDFYKEGKKEEGVAGKEGVGLVVKVSDNQISWGIIDKKGKNTKLKNEERFLN